MPLTVGQLPEQIISHPHELASCCQYLASCPRFGLDTEFVGEDTFHPRLCLVQVATPERLILIDPVTAGPLDSFWRLVVDPTRQIIVHAGREDVRLCRLWSGQAPGNLFDLQIAAALVGYAYPLGHGPLVHQVLGIQLAKGETLTEWRDRPLTQQQLRYAFDDVRHLLAVFGVLDKRLCELERQDWAREEFTRLANHAPVEDASQEKWRKLRGLGTLDRRRLAIVREVCRWREQLAEHKNRPPRTIIRDDLIVEIARRSPTRERDLAVIRGLPRTELAGILSAVERAGALPLEHCPALFEREQDPPQAALLSNVLLALLGDVCVRASLAPNVVCSTQDIRTLVRSRLQGRELPSTSILAEGWRSRHILPRMLEFLDGKQSIRVADVHAEAPFSVTNLPETAKQSEMLDK
jgi:ribonuclease D